MIRSVVSLIGITNQALVRVSGLLPEIVKSVAALPSPKRLRAGRPKGSPTRPSVSRSMGELITGIRSIFARDQGGSPKRFHRPNRFRVWLHELKGESGSQCYYGVGPIYLNEGLMKPRKGFTLTAGEENLGVGKVDSLLQKM